MFPGYTGPGFNTTNVSMAPTKPFTLKEAESNTMACLNSYSPAESTATNCESTRSTSWAVNRAFKRVFMDKPAIFPLFFYLPVSLDRGRAHLDSKERQLMKQIRCLRERLVARAKEESIASSQSLYTPNAASHWPPAMTKLKPVVVLYFFLAYCHSCTAHNSCKRVSIESCWLDIF